MPSKAKKCVLRPGFVLLLMAGLAGSLWADAQELQGLWSPFARLYQEQEGLAVQSAGTVQTSMGSLELGPGDMVLDLETGRMHLLTQWSEDGQQSPQEARILAVEENERGFSITVEAQWSFFQNRQRTRFSVPDETHVYQLEAVRLSGADMAFYYWRRGIHVFALEEQYHWVRTGP